MKKTITPLPTLLVLFCTALLAAEEWTLTGGTGKKTDDGVLEVTGTGRDSNAWLSPPVPIEAGEHYRFFMEASADGAGGGGCAPCGLAGFARDRSDIVKTWKPFSYVFQAPAGRSEYRLRVGQWHANQTYRFRNIGYVPVVPIHRGILDPKDPNRYYLLGEDEILKSGVYQFNGGFSGEGANAHRVFVEGTSGFNSDRFPFGGEQELIYCFNLLSCRLDQASDSPEDGTPFLTGKVEINLGYHVKGECIVEVSVNPAKGWTEVGKIESVGTLSGEVPESMLPAQLVFLRIRGGKGASFQVDRVNFEAKIPDDLNLTGLGETVFADVKGNAPAVPEGYTSEPLFFGARRTLYVRHRNDSDAPVKPLLVNPPSRMQPQYTISGPFDAVKGEMPAKSTCVETKPLGPARDDELAFSDGVLKYSFPYHPYRDADFGYPLPAAKGEKAAAGLWWCEPDWKVSPDKAPPTTKRQTATDRVVKPRPVAVSAAKNDYESFQLVVNGEAKGRQGLTATLGGDLQGPGGATIAAANVELRYAYYHFVHRKTDRTGLLGDWPDALPPLETPLDVRPLRNQPIWVTVYVPADAAAGTYAGQVTLAWNEDGDKVERAVPFELKVWNFALPKRNTLETAYGTNAGTIFRYHNCKTDEDKRAVWEMYLDNFAKHRISMYTPTPMDGIKVEWQPEANPPCAEVDFGAFDKEMERVVAKYGFTNFRLGLQGMGGGTFESRRTGKIGKFEEGTPEYEAMFSDYVRKLEAHLKEKGRLDMAYIYWFDEPAPKDYEFVAKGFAKLQKYAPGLARMITEEPNPGFIEALDKEKARIDIWCPVSYNYDDDAAKARMAKDERFWWYVCTGPKAPYCTLFIDHPGTELRVWHWQTWQRNVVGTLVWTSTYWTSPSAFPDTPQNPYEDPMGYVAGGPKGSKRYWGNGDGRFVYPPLAAALPGPKDAPVVLKPPVSSIRWEMIREGVEDYEMLAMLRGLKEKNPGAAERIDTLLTVPAEITSEMTVFTTDPEPIYQRRRLIAEEIEKLR